MSVAVVGGWLVLSVVVLAGWTRINTVTAWRSGALVLTLGLSLVHQLVFSTVAEDAYITFRYSLNIAEGNGPVFNPGERVEGYSNFLWTILIALPKVLFGWEIVDTAVVLGVICTLGCVLMAYFLVNRIVGRAVPAAEGESRHPRPALGVAAAVLTAGASSLAAYGPAGLETPLFLLLALSVCYALAARRPVVAGLLVALAGMTRPDGLVIAVIAGGWLTVAALRKRQSWWAPAGYALGAMVFAVPWMAWRVTYYGHFLPNAIAAKNGGSLGWQLGQGWTYLRAFGLVHQGFLLLALVAVAALPHRRPAGEAEAEARRLVWLIFAIAVAYLAFVTYAGGDWMPAWRLLSPVPPLVAIASVAAYGVLTAGSARGEPSSEPRRYGRLVPVAALVLCGTSLLVSVTSPNMRDGMHDWRHSVRQLAEIGSWLGDTLPPGTVISTYANGALSYEAGTRIQVVDVLGLTDEHIAREGKRDETAGPIGHIASDYGYVVNVRKPALAVTSGGGYVAQQYCGISPVYAGKYQVATFRRAGAQEWIAVYPRNEQAATLISQLGKDPRFVYVPCPA